MTRTLTEHWDGTAWTIVSSPNLGSGNNYLQGVVAFCKRRVGSGLLASPIVCRVRMPKKSYSALGWNCMSVSSTPNLPAQNNYLWAVAGSGPDVRMGSGRA